MLENLFDYPIMIENVDVANYFGINDFAEIAEVLRTTHQIVYDYVIYPTYNADIKNRIIEKYREHLVKPIGRALLAQFKYLYENGGNIAEWNGLIGGAQGVDSKESQEILTKVIAPSVINILKGAAVDILYAGG